MMILAPEKTTIEGGCILIVDDDDGVRENLAELFEVVGYSVVTAASAPEAIEKLAQGDVDLLLTDYRMPGPNGVELIESARRMKPHLRAILMTAFGDSFTEIEGLGLVYCERELPSRNGKGLQLFRSRLTSVRITLEDGNLRARVEIGPSAVLAATHSEVMEQTLNLRGAFVSA